MAQQTDGNKMKSTQTALEWLLEEYPLGIPRKILGKAKRMEKEQIIEAFDMGCKDEDRIGLEYYNDTFLRT